jgi:hypothetical protein
MNAQHADDHEADNLPATRVEIMPSAREQVSEATALVHLYERAALNPQIDLDRLQRIQEMHAQVQSRTAETAYNAAMSLAQAEMGPVSHDAENTHTKSRYTTYAALDRAIRPIYTKHGFSLSFYPGKGAPEGYVRVACKVAHRDGYSERPEVDMPADGAGAKGGAVMTKTHATGSAFSYGQRYLLKLIFNIATGEGDDDGNGAGGETINQEQVDDLNALMEEVRADRNRFLNFFKVDGLSSIRAKDYRRALAMLEAKRRA